jgi:cytochrome c553
MSHPFLKLVLGMALAFGAGVVAAQPKPPADKAPKVDEKRPATTDKPLGMENAHAMCIGCHGIPGYKTAFPSTYHVPKIAGQQPGYIVSALKAYKSGERSHPSMRGIAASLTEETIKELADYYGGGRK